MLGFDLKKDYHSLVSKSQNNTLNLGRRNRRDKRHQTQSKFIFEIRPKIHKLSNR